MSTRAPPPSGYLHGDVLRWLLASSEEDCRALVINILSTLTEAQRQAHGIPHVEDLQNWLQNYPQLFSISTDDVTGFPCVSPTTTLTFCVAHSARAGSCSKRACAALHICCFFLLSGKCPHGKGCHFGHRLDTEHNRRLLEQHRLLGLETAQIRRLFCLARVRRGIACPRVCRFYNIATKCDKGEECNFVHLCKYFVTGKCKFKSGCKRSHDIKDSQVRQVLELYGIRWKGLPVADILSQINSSDSIQSPRKKLSAMANANRDGFSPDIYGSDISSHSDSPEEGEISEDCTQSPNAYEDDRNNRPQLMASSMLKGIRERQKEPGAPRWENEAPHTFNSVEERKRRRESLMSSRLLPDDNMRRYSSPRMYQDNQRSRDSPQRLCYLEDSSPSCESGDKSRGYKSPEMLARERGDPTLSTRRYDWQRESVQRRSPSPRVLEYDQRSNSPHLAINRERYNSPYTSDQRRHRETPPVSIAKKRRNNSWQLPINRERYNSPYTSDQRRHRETPPVSKAKKRRNNSWQLIEDNWESELHQFEIDTGRHGKKKRHSIQELSDDEDSELMFNHPETDQRRRGISNHPREDRIFRLSPRPALTAYESRRDSPQTSGHSAENEVRNHTFQEKNQARPKVERILKKRHTHIHPPYKRPYHLPGTLGRRPVSNPRKLSSSRQRHQSKMDWTFDY